MSDEKVVDIETAKSRRISISNAEVMALVPIQQEEGMRQTPIRVALDRIQEASSINGKLQYNIYKVWKKITDLRKEIEDFRINLAKEHADKDEEGNIVYVDAEYQFDPDKRKEFDEAIKQATVAMGGNVSEKMRNEIAEQFCKRKENGKPIRTGGNAIAINGENLNNFRKAFIEMTTVENDIGMNKVVVSSDMLEKMNAKAAEGKQITVDDMVMLESIFEFVD